MSYAFNCSTPMVLLPAFELLTIGEIPRSDTTRHPRITIDQAIQIYGGRKRIFVVFVSHRWFNDDADLSLAHPDSSSGAKYKLICRALKKISSEVGEEVSVLVWIDFFSIDQFDPELKNLGIKSLPSYAERSDCFLTPVTDQHYSGELLKQVSGLPVPDFLQGQQLGKQQRDQLMSFSHTKDVFSRSWIRLEQFLCSNTTLNDSHFNWFAHTAPNSWRRDRPHLFVTPAHLEDDYSLITLPIVSRQILAKNSPLDGEISRTGDLKYIQDVMQECGFDRRTEPSYKGEVDSEGRPHGFGGLEFADGEYYEGDWEHGKREGYGRSRYADGSEYQGEFSQGFRHGVGQFSFASGNRYQGDFVHGHQLGAGSFTWSNGNFYRGNFFAGRCHGMGIRRFESPTKQMGGWKVEVTAMPGDQVEGTQFLDNPCGVQVRHDKSGVTVGYEPRGNNRPFTNIADHLVERLPESYQWAEKECQTVSRVIAPAKEIRVLSELSPSDRWSEGDRVLSVQCDSNSFLAAIPSRSIDIVCTDPPYNIGLTSSWDYVAMTVYLQQVKDWSRQLRRILKPGGIGFVFMNVMFAGDWMRHLIDPATEESVITCEYLIHLKTNSSRQEELARAAKSVTKKSGRPAPTEQYLSSKEFRESTDVILMYRHASSSEAPDPFRKAVEEFRGEQLGFDSSIWPADANLLLFPKPEGHEKILMSDGESYHLAQKPTPLTRLLCRARSGSEAVVCDPFAGSGTTAVSSVLEGKTCITCEADEEYSISAADRAVKEPLVNFILERDRLFGTLGTAETYQSLMSRRLQSLIELCRRKTVSTDF